MKTQFTNLLLFLTLFFLPLQLQSQSWEPQAFGLLPVNYSVFGISVVNENVIWAVAWDRTVSPPVPLDHITKVIKTSDGGINWEVYDVEEAEGKISFDIVGFDENTAFITTQTYNNGLGRGVFKTEDGGETWIEKFHHHAGGVWIRFFNQNDGVIINRASMATTSDGGESWDLVPEGNFPAFQSNEYTIFYSGTNSCQILNDHVWFGTSGGRVYRSKDKGLTWEAFHTSLGSTALVSSVAFKDTLNGIAIDASSSITQFSKTTDGGETWDGLISSPGLPIKNIAFVPGTGNTLTGTGSYYSGTRVSAYSIDLGATWEIIDENTPFSAIQFITPSTGWASRGFVTAGNEAAMYKWDGFIFVGVDYVDSFDSYLIFPNPFSDVIFIEGDNNSPEIKPYFLYDNNGKMLMSGVIKTANAKLELATLDPGVYYLVLKTKDYKAVKKIVKVN